MPRRSKNSSEAPKRERKKISTRMVGPSVNHRSIELALLLFMSERSDTEETRKRLAVIESAIKAHGADKYVEELVSKHCDRDTLLRSIGLACGRPVDFLLDNWFTKPGPESLENLFGLNGRNFSALLERLLRAADDVEDIRRRFEFGILLTSRHLQVFQGLPELIRGYVSLLKLASEKLGRGTHLYRNLGMAILTLYVRQQTGRFHDEQVSALLAAARDNDRYDAGNQRAWRQEQKDLLASIDRLVPIFTSESVQSAINNPWPSPPQPPR
jgi:hypothetical protein